MRKITDKGTDVAIVLPPGTTIRNGDVIFFDKDRIILMELQPESVAIIEMKDYLLEHDNHSFGTAVRLGHTLGNLHRPIKINDHKIYVPIQADSEIETLHNLFGPINDHLTITKSKMVFEAEEGLENHEHA
jgi:urease accessory protein